VLSPTGGPGTFMPGTETLQEAELSGRASNALVLAILGLFCCGLVSLIGMFMGISVLSDANRLRISASSAKSKAIAAIICGIVAALIWLVSMIVMAGQGQSGG